MTKIVKLCGINRITPGHFLYGDLSEIRPPEIQNITTWIIANTVHILIYRYDDLELDEFRNILERKWKKASLKQKIFRGMDNSLIQFI